MNKEIIEVTTYEQLGELYDHNAMTWEGLVEEDFQEAIDRCGDEGAKGYLTKGKVMNEICHLEGKYAYPDDLNIFSVYPFKGIASNYCARWMDNIIDGIAYDVGDYHPFYYPASVIEVSNE